MRQGGSQDEREEDRKGGREKRRKENMEEEEEVRYQFRMKAVLFLIRKLCHFFLMLWFPWRISFTIYFSAIVTVKSHQCQVPFSSEIFLVSRKITQSSLSHWYSLYRASEARQQGKILVSFLNLPNTLD